MRAIVALGIAVALGSALASAKPRRASEAATACSDGQAATGETSGHCCWPGQRWRKGACTGTPRACPAGMGVDGERCVACATLVESAIAHYKAGEFADALRLARACGDDSDDKWRVVGASACALHERPEAIDAQAHLLDERGRQYVDYVCKKNGITLETRP